MRGFTIAVAAGLALAAPDSDQLLRAGAGSAAANTLRTQRQGPAFLPDLAGGMTLDGPGAEHSLVRLVVPPVDPKPVPHTAVQAADNDYLYACRDGFLWRSTDGESFDKTTIPASYAWVLPNGSLFLVRYVAPGDQTFRISADQGATATEVVTPPQLSPAGLIAKFGLHAQADTVMACEYGGMANEHGGRRIFRSTDSGSNWHTVYDSGVSDLGNEVTHWHGIGYHAGSHRWLVNAGDGSQRRTMYSADGGTSWAILVPQDPAGLTGQVQTMDYVDFGDPTRILCMGDDLLGIYVLDVHSGKVVWDIGTLFQYSLHTFFWSAITHAGVIYAGGVDDAASTKATTIAVASLADPYRWTKLVDLQDDGLAYGAGYFRGRIYWSRRLSNGSLSHLAVRDVTRAAPVVRPAGRNLLPPAEALPESSMVSAVFAPGTKWCPRQGISSGAYMAAGGPVKDAGFVRISTPSGGQTGCFVPVRDRGSAVVPGDVVYGGLWMRSQEQVSCRVTWHTYGGEGPGFQWTLTPAWRHYPLPAFVVHNPTLGISVAGLNTAGRQPVTLDAACAWMSTSPVYEWFPDQRANSGGRARLRVGPRWCHLFGILPQERSWHLGPGLLRVRAWTAGEAQLDLLCDGSAPGFVLQQYRAGVQVDSLMVPVTFFHMDAQVWFALNVDSRTVRLDVWNASTHLPAAEMALKAPQLCRGLLTTASGIDDSPWLPHAIDFERVFDRNWTAADLEAWLQDKLGLR